VIRGDLADTFEKGGQTITRTLAEDRTWHAPSGSAFSLPGRSLLFVRNVGHLMTNPAILLADGSKSPKASWTRSSPRRSHARREGPWPLPQQPHRQHLHRQAQDARAGGSGLHQRPVRCGRRPAGLPRHTVKVGVMDEERRTSANLAACIAAVKDRVVFINTGFLDRTGDEIHTSMQAGPMIRKGA
jgi:malate synthase